MVRNYPTTTDRQAWVGPFVLPESLIPEILSFSPTGVVVKDGASHEFSWNIDRAQSATIPGTTGGIFAITPNVPAAGLETVTITVPASTAAAGKLFGRLRVSAQ